MKGKLIVIAAALSAVLCTGGITVTATGPADNDASDSCMEDAGALHIADNQDGTAALGSYTLQKNEAYTVTVYWNEDGSGTLFCTGTDTGKAAQERSQTVYEISKGVPLLLTVPQDGVYNLTVAGRDPMTHISCQVDIVSSEVPPDSMKTIKIENETWYLIETEAHLRSIGQNSETLSRHYRQNADIIITSNWVSLGGDIPFTGSYDGSGYKITGNLQINGKYSGLFGTAKNADIRNVTIMGRGPVVSIAEQTTAVNNNIINLE